ncbi:MULTISPECIES: glutamine-hydrolyzing GMP synthase [unclassified Psychrobacter]|uniref:glutamine-hydrolyzing GMP synthase n=1 Tax=unclassified Psychrobacter TaxID=196806 RepID=UPI0003FCF739|nr:MULTISPECIES: glutamine-hydrolyzing GMP synthase [unclassified Psychrobacter]
MTTAAATSTIPTIKQDRILILDFGSQYSQLIARRVRDSGVFCEMFPYDIDTQRIIDFGAKGVILSGGPESVHAENSPRINDAVFELGVPVLGICYGMQAMADRFGGQVHASDIHEFGAATIEVTGHSQLTDGIEDSKTEGNASKLNVWMSHGDKVIEVPEGFDIVASTPSCPIAIMANDDKQYYGLQFHPEVTHTLQGQELLGRFVHQICGCAGDWTPDNIADMRIAQLKEQIGDKQVLLGLSGGVDSSVVAALLHKAIGDQLTCVFVDNGLLRLHEGDQVMQVFAENMGVKVIRVDAEDLFLDALAGESDPEKKRKIIGKTFIDVFADSARQVSEQSDGKVIEFLAQGTIYPDVIESAKSHQGKAHVIKSHHNVGGLPDDLAFELVEPLRDLFKDEVRKLGITLGLPAKMIYRHPFPGPGLGVRILGEVKKEYADILRLADAIFMQELERSGWYDKTAQAFAVFQPIKSVGVVGDGRRYAWVIALRAVETVDFMTARFAHLPYDLIETVSNRIMNEIAEVSRVTYDVSSKPPATIEWE